MCGIAGGFALSKGDIESMCQSMHHRGPDGMNFYCDRDFAMGMVRLAIQDPRNGQQPFYSQDGKISVVCNGEIYNWRELRAELEEKGYLFKTECDVEILPACWQAWGAEMFARLNGMFALAIYDLERRELILARDQCGQKPLYLCQQGKHTLFASEIRAFRHAGISLNPNNRQLASYLMQRYVSEPDTLFKEVSVLPAAHWARISNYSDCKIQRYWRPESAVADIRAKTLDEAIDELDGISKKSVAQTMQSDWKSVLYLSSGVDSNMLGCYLKELGADVSSLTIGFQSAQDETTAAEQTAKTFGFEHENIFLDCDALDHLPTVVRQMERPVGDALILAFDALAKGAKQLGAKIAYGAEGIDEHFGGYSFHKAYFQARRLGTVGRYTARTFLKYAPDAVVAKLANFPAALGDEGKQRVIRYLKKFDVLSGGEQTDFLRFLYIPDELKAVLSEDMSKRSHGSDSDMRSMNHVLARQYDSWLQDWSLIRQDKNSMAHSIEFRAPFLNPKLIDFAFSSPDRWKISARQDKAIWRRLAQKKLPSEIAFRPKIPFYLPLEEESWRKKLVQMSENVLSKEAISNHGWFNFQEITRLQEATEFLPLKKLSALLIFQLWYDQNFTRVS